MSNPFSSSYIEPNQASKYLKLTEGTHVFRIVTPKEEVLSYFVEFVDGTDDTGKAIKRKVITPDKGDGKQPNNSKRSWAFKIFNQDLQIVQVWECGQKSLQESLANIARGKIRNDWTKFDIQVTRKGQTMMDTEYFFLAGDTEELTSEAKTIIADTYVNLDALQLGEDPFESTNTIKSDSPEESDLVSDDLPDVDSIEIPF